MTDSFMFYNMYHYLLIDCSFLFMYYFFNLHICLFTYLENTNYSELLYFSNQDGGLQDLLGLVLTWISAIYGMSVLAK